jgi:hypothetical protein
MDQTEGKAMGVKRRCSARTASGAACRAWAVHGSDPPRCAAHGGGTPIAAAEGAGGARPCAAPAGQPAAKRGFYSRDPAAVDIEEAIAGMVDKMQRLDEMIISYEQVAAASGRTNGYLVKLLALYGRYSTRLMQMLRARRALSGEAADGFASAIAQALDELGSEWGTDL